MSERANQSGDCDYALSVLLSEIVARQRADGN